MFLDFIEDEGFAFEVVYNNETNKVEIYIVYWYNDKKKRWKTKLIFQGLHPIKSVVSEKFDGSYTIFFDNCMEIMKQLTQA